MHTLLFVVLVYSSLGLISATIPPSIIDSDANEINNLADDFQKFSPKIVHRFIKATCQMIAQCCPQQKSQFISMSLSGDTKNVTEQCLGTIGLSKLLSCSPLTRITMMASDPDLTNYVSIISKSAQDKMDSKLILNICSEEEVYAIACDWDKTEKKNACQRKVLQVWAEQGDQIYMNKVKRTKEDYTTLNDALKKYFNMN